MTAEQALTLTPETPVWYVWHVPGGRSRVVLARFARVVPGGSHPPGALCELHDGCWIDTDRVHLGRNAALADLANLVRARIAELTADLARIETTTTD